MTKYDKMTPNQLQLQVMSNVTKLVRLVSNGEYLKASKMINKYSLPLQYLTDLANK